MPDILRNRFRLLPALDGGRRGFLLDATHLPDAGATTTTEASFWDGDNSAALDAYDVPLVSGRLLLPWTRAARRRGQAWFRAGIGGNGDLRLSGLTDAFRPVVDAGEWFDLDEPQRAWSDDAVETVYVSGALFLDPPPADHVPVELAAYHVDPWGRARTFERFAQRQSFTAASGLETLSPIPGTDPVLRPRTRAGILWQNVDASRKEFLVDEATNELILNGSWTSGVRASVRRAPWSRDAFQLPLVPVAGIDGVPVLDVREDPVVVSGGVGWTAVRSGVASSLVTRGSGIRLSGDLSASGAVLWASGSLAGWPASGLVCLDDGDWGREVAAYAALSGQCLSGLVRTSGTAHRDGAPLRLVVSGTLSADGRLSGVADGTYAVDYRASGFGWTLDARRGLFAVFGASGLHRAVLNVDYTRGLALTYEPSGGRLEASLDPVDFLAGGASHGLLWASRYPLRPRAVRLATSQGAGTSGIVGPVYAGNDYLAVEATVVDRAGTPIPGVPVRLVLDQPTEVGLVDGREPSDALAAKTTDAFGTARFVYTPPDTIRGLGYFVPAAAVVSGSGIFLPEPVAYEEFCPSGTWTSRLYSVWRDDAVLGYAEESGVFDWRADGRFEIVSRVAATVAGLQDWEPVTPAAVVDVSGKAAGPGRMVQALWFPSGSLPSDPNVGAFFVGAEKRLRLGAVVPGTGAVSPSFELAVGIPPFMAGEFLWGPATDPDVKALDSLSYLTVDPLKAAFSGMRTGPNLVGNVFHVRRAKTDEFLRNRLYLKVDAAALAASADGVQRLRQMFALRNRVILERD